MLKALLTIVILLSAAGVAQAAAPPRVSPTIITPQQLPGEPFDASWKGTVYLNCKAHRDGSLSGCAVATEDPQGAGLAEQAMTISKTLKVDFDKVPGEGDVRPVQVPISFGFQPPVVVYR